MTSRLLICWCSALLAASQLTAAAAPAEPAQTYALLVGGFAGQEPYARWYPDWLNRFQTVLTKSAGIPASNITVLSGDAGTSDAILAAIGKIAGRSKPQDQVILFIVGHGEMESDTPALTLPGPDLSAKQLADAMNAVPAGSQIILNFSANSGNFLKLLVSPNRVNLTATSPTEVEEPVFAEFFLRGLESRRADADKSGTITLLEAYNWAAQQTAQWIVRWERTGPEKQDPANPQPTTWKASGKETIEIFEKLYSGLPTRKLDPASNRSVEDAAVEVQPPNGQVTPEWRNRRVIDEHALLEDCGQPLGVSVLGEKGIQPILGLKPNDPGYLAGQTVPGKPTPMNP